MADNYGDEEYKLPEPESSDVFGGSEPTSQKPNMMKRNLLLLVGLLLMAFVIYKLLGTFTGGKKPAPTLQPKPPVMAQLPAQPRPTVQQVQQNQPVNMSNVNKVSGLERRLNQNNMKIKELTQSVTVMKNSVTDLSSRLDDSNYAMQKLTRQITVLQTTIYSLQHKFAKRRRVRKRIVKTVYYIQAIIPGRAWLKSKKGSTLTVSKGDRLRGYGRIVDIQPKLGRIVTSSGSVIRYSPEER